MVADPGQTAAINKPEVAARLAQAVADFRASVPSPKEERPFTVGYAEFPMTPLPARDGVPHGKVRRSAGAPNCSYFTNWSSPDDSMTWDIAVHTTGEYEAVVYYTCPAADAGSTVELSFGNAKLAGQVAPAWNPPLIDNQDRVPRKGESYLKEFRELRLGKFRLEQGRGTLTLRALRVTGKQVADVRLITLTLKGSQ
jgi:hypothetical protein